MPQWLIVVCATFFFIWTSNFKASNSFAAFYQQRSMPLNNHKINPKPCSVNGLDGTCMFVWQCINTEGHHIGMCVDTFMFGSCCAHNLTSVQISQLAVDSSEPAVLYTQFANNSNNLINENGRPVIAGPNNNSNKPFRQKLKPSTTARPTYYNNGHTESSAPVGALAQQGSGHIGRPYNNNNNNQIRPNNNMMMYNGISNSIDRIQYGSDDWTTSAKPFVNSFPTPSQQFYNNFNINNKQSSPPSPSLQTTFKPYMAITSQPSKLSSVYMYPSTTSAPIISTSPHHNINTATSGRPTIHNINTATSGRPTITAAFSTVSVRPQFVSKPSTNYYYYNYSSHFSSTTTTAKTTTTTTESWSNQNLESNEIEDIDSSSSYSHNHHSPFHQNWQTSSSQQPITFITKPKPPPTSVSNKYKPWIISSTSKYPNVHSQLLQSSGFNITKLQTTKPLSLSSVNNNYSTNFAASTTHSVTNSPLPDKPKTSTITTLSVASVSASSPEKSTQCGVSPLHPRQHEIRIVGGRNAQFGIWAWQVSVRRTSFFGFSSTHRCGGALLNENWIATAGHCVDDLLTSQIKIRVGEYDFSSVQEPYPFAERGVARKIVHPKYNFFTYEYDLAVVKLDSPLEYAPHIVPICLPGSDDLLIGENATVTGWGRLSEGGTLPSILQEVSVPIVSNDKCKSMFLRAGRHEYIPEIFMCAGFDNGGRDSCQGDSGGPLQVRGKDGRYFLAGIISWGIGCAEANLPGVCTRISKFVPWILQTVT